MGSVSHRPAARPRRHGRSLRSRALESGRRLALKVLRGRLQDAEDRARFLREGQLAASISHPHTVYIFGSEEIAGVPVISMELLPGGTLKDRVAAEGPLPPAAAVSAVLDIIGGLDAAQAAGILHRDIKPSNCFVDSDGSVKVGDFGLSISTLARDVHQQLATRLRGHAAVRRARAAARRAARRARGHLRRRRHALLPAHRPAAVRRARSARAGRSREHRAAAVAARAAPRDSAGLAAVVLQCLAKDPAQRPASYAALAEVLRPFSILDETPAAAGLRLLAGVVDIVPAVAAGLDLECSEPLLIIDGQSPVTSQPWTWLMNLVYFFVLEARWGTSLGKRLFGLRLSSPGGAGWVMKRRAPHGRLSHSVARVRPAGPLGRSDRPHERSPAERKQHAQSQGHSRPYRRPHHADDGRGAIRHRPTPQRLDRTSRVGERDASRRSVGDGCANENVCSLDTGS